MTQDPWLPFASALLGGFLTLSSSLVLEKYRLRAADRRDLLRRRRAALEELERSAIDAHAKLQTAANLSRALFSGDAGAGTSLQGTAPDASAAQTSRTDNQLLMTALAEGTGKVEILRALSLAARVGSAEIRRAVSDYASTQMEWTKSPQSGAHLLLTLEAQIREVLNLVASELRTIDEVVASDL
jgi:hypothetical protein